MKNLKRYALILILSIGSAQTANAEKVDDETQNQLIKRLERVVALMEPKNPSWVQSHLRLADLLSERARIRFMDEVQKNCNNCTASSNDRKEAISIYESVLPKASVDEQGPIFFQLAHLYDTQGNTNKAIELYNKVSQSKKFSKDLVSHAEEGLGDIYFFEKVNFKLAQSHYTQALIYKEARNRALLTYRIAWCEFSLDHLALATHDLENLLAHPELIVKNNPDGTQVVDASLKTDISKDLASFYSRSTVNSEIIRRYIVLIPKDQHKDLLLFFAGETDRLGQKKAAHEIYEAYLHEDLTKEERLNALVSNTQTQYDSGHNMASAEDFAAAAKTYSELNCKDPAQCKDIQKRMKHFVTEFHRANKGHVTPAVLSVYATYANTFPADFEMAALGAQTAMSLKNYPEAITLYHQSGKAAIDSKNDKLAMAAVLGEIDAAELSKNSEAREKAYNNYLGVFPKGDKQFEIRYQLAQLAYENKKYPEASQKFSALALDPSGGLELRKKSADLALDCLVIEKRDDQIEISAQQFAQALPRYKNEYLKISRKAMINQVALVANNQKSSSSEMHSALLKLKSANLAGTSDAEKILHFKNALVLAEKSGDNESYIESLEALLTIRSLSASERESILAQKEGFFETHLDFEKAYLTALKMKFPHISQAEKELRLGTLAELANLSPIRHYQAYIKLSPKASQAQFVRTRLVLLSSAPFKELKKYKSDLVKNPEMMSHLLLTLYGRTHDSQSINPYLKISAVAKTPSATFIAKQSLYKEQMKFAQNVSRHRITSKNQKVFQKSIKDGIRILADVDTSLKKSIRTNDYTLQIMSLATVSRENYRFVADLLAQPLPKGLKKAEQDQYVALLKKQAFPYMSKAKAADQKLQEFWNNTQARANLLAEYDKTEKEIRPMLAFEIRILLSLAPDSVKSELSSALTAKDPNYKDLMAARQAVSKDPHNPQLLKQLADMESKFGHLVMANYLENRMNQNKKQEVL